MADLGEGPGVPPPPLIFGPNWVLKGLKKFGGDQAPPRCAPLLSKGLGDCPPSPSPPCLYLKVWIRHLKMDYCFGSSILKWEYWLEILNEVWNEVFIQYSDKIISSEMFKSGTYNKSSLPCHECNYRPHALSIDTFQVIRDGYSCCCCCCCFISFLTSSFYCRCFFLFCFVFLLESPVLF